MTAISKRHKKEKSKGFRTINAPEIDTLSGGDIEVKKFVLDLIGGGDIDVVESITSGEILLDLVSPQVSVTVHDQARFILKSGKLWDSDGELRAIDVFLDGEWWRLTRYDKQGDDLVLTLELRKVARLNAKKGPRKAASRARVTRAQYILSLIRSVKSERIEWEIPELTKTQPVAKQTDKERRDAEKGKTKDRGGFDKDVKISGVSDAQLRNISVFMEEVDKLDAPVRAAMAGLVAGFGESGWDKSKTDYKTHTHKGVFQSNQIPPEDLEAQSHYFLVGGRSFLAGGAIGYAKNHEFATLGEIAAKVEISDGSTAYYNTFRGKAKKVYDAWHGGTGSASSQTLYKRYEYKVEKGQSYWKAIQDMAEQVRWHAFFSGGTFYYISEERLFASPAKYVIEEGKNGVTNIDVSQDYRKKFGKATVSARLDRWKAPPGTTVLVEGLNERGSQRWLVESIRRDLFSANAEIGLKRLTPARKEPRSTPYQREATEEHRRGHVEGETDTVTDDMLQFLQEIAGETDEHIKIFPNSRHSKYTKDGGISNHNSGNAADIDTGGDARSSDAAGRKGDLIAIATMVVCGLTRQEAKRRIGGPTTSFITNLTWGKYSIEIGWRTLTGGNHYNHVHVGFDNWQEVQIPSHVRAPKDRRSPSNRSERG